ncbi:hypothetical protein OE810_08875 [Rhodobacteraceae bacterium XHP0102]|nr:hypothetical protein [Rhodobacteraceae bacterium XHP0102]
MLKPSPQDMGSSTIAMSEKQKRSRGVSSERNSSMIREYVKGARNVNPKCESESRFGVGGFPLDSADPKLAWVDS